MLGLVLAYLVLALVGLFGAGDLLGEGELHLPGVRVCARA
jgi:hypothetical protein